jgi:hypothetical protein
MATHFPSITDEQALLISRAPVFFVASADPELCKGPHGVGPVNLSPKGGGPLLVLGPNRVAFLDHRGSGNETARHAVAGGPITVMVCSFEEDNAAIVRLYGTARVSPVEASSLADRFPSLTGAFESWPRRQVVDIAVESTATSCGYGVPVATSMRVREVAERGRLYKVGPRAAARAPVR